VELPVFAYYGYRAVLSDGSRNELLPVTTGDGNRVRAALPQDVSGRLTVSFDVPFYWRAADLISLLTWLAMSVWARLHGHKKTQGGSPAPKDQPPVMPFTGTHTEAEA
ncbi:MAG: hypothetical protein J6I56_04545, partial [Lachnospiraceae bacterium]|nr:hypothetical protein [Lachnospiraceae bacterium]